jgi:hypothetical protein
MPEIYVACSFKWKDAERGEGADEDGYALPAPDGHWTTREAARKQAHGEFTMWAQKQKESSHHRSSTIRSDVTVWAPGREEPERDVLWVLYERAAPAMDDKNRESYPQMRESLFWVETILVRDVAADDVAGD